VSLEGHLRDQKSLRLVLGKSADWAELAKDCIAFSNASGGHLLIGIEDGETLPPAGQIVPIDLPDTLRRKLAERTVNLMVLPEIRTAANGGGYIDLHIQRGLAVSSTTDGRYFLRISDQSKPVTGDEILRLAHDRSALPWETMRVTSMSRSACDSDKLRCLADALRASDRVKSSVKEKSDAELLDHYQLAQGEYLTHLGALCVGTQLQRGQLGTAPVIQCIKHDACGQKISKQVWDDHTLNPMELVEAVWREVPDFRERYELPDGLYRQSVPAFDEVVVRELLVNALVHRPYIQRGDIFLNLYPDRLDVVNPGLLPLGVTPQNVLHTTVRRNEHLARLFHDLKLMEREGSGMDKIFEVLLSQGKRLPVLTERHDRVQVTVYRQIINPDVIDFITKADRTFQLSQRERITLGLLAQHDGLTARELAETLTLPSAEDVHAWLGRLPSWQLIQKVGRTQSMRYFVDPELLRSLAFSAVTTLKRIEPHRLEALLLEDLRRYPASSISEIHRRIGREIHRAQVKRTLDFLIANGSVRADGEKRWRRYFPV